MLMVFSGLGYANDCVNITPESQIRDTLDAECQKQILGIDVSIEKLHGMMFSETEESTIKIALGSLTPSADVSSGGSLMLTSVGYFSMMLISVIVLMLVLGVGVGIWKARNDDKGRSFLTNGAFSANLVKMAAKVIPSAQWNFLATAAIAMSLFSLALLVVNIQVINYKQNQLDVRTYASDIRDKSRTRASDDVGSVIKYYACLIDHDKRLLYDNSVKPDYIFEKSDYSTCMMSDSSKLDETKTSFISRHLYKIKDCGLKYANLTTANCGSFEFKNDAQQILKEKYIALEPKLLGLANDYLEYYCANQTVVDLDSELKNYCWKFNPVSYSVSLDGKGRITPITSSKSYTDIKATSKEIEAEIAMALQATAVEHFKTYVPITAKFGLIAYFESKINAGKNIKAIKNYNSAAMDYSLKFVPEFQYSELESGIKSTETFILGGRQSTSSHNQAINKIIDQTVAVSEDQLIKNIVIKFSSFLGRGFVESMGVKYEEGGDYNILSTTIASGQEAATYLITSSIGLKIVEAGLSLAGTKNFSGKPDLKAVTAERTVGFASDLFHNLGIVIAGSVITLTMIFVLSFMSQFMSAIQNIIKIAYILELSFYVDGIDKDKGERFNHDDIVRKLITLLYIVLIFPAIIFEFEIGFHVSYMLVEVAKDNFYLINQSAGYVVDSANSLMAVVYQLIMMAIFHVVVIIAMLIGIKKTNDSVHTILIQKLYSAGDVKSALMLEDRDKIARATESHLMSARKAPRSQRI